MFLVALGVPLSWEKVDLQADLSWIGWRLDFRHSIALLPEDKRAKLCAALAALVKPGVKVERRCLERTIGHWRSLLASTLVTVFVSAFV